MDHIIKHVIVKEYPLEASVQIEFQCQDIAIPPVEISTIENDMPEYYSTKLYQHLQQYQIQGLCYMFIYNPLKGLVQDRHNQITHLSANLILKLLNIRFIPIVLSTIDVQMPTKLRDSPVIDKLGDYSQAIIVDDVKYSKEFQRTYQKFKELYRIKLIDLSTQSELQPKKAEQIKIVYVPTQELVCLKTLGQVDMQLGFEMFKSSFNV